MKITRKQIRKIIKEEAKRELPISYYSDEILMQEGLLKFLGGLFGKLVGFFSDAYDKAEKNVGSRFGKAGANVQSIAQKVLGKDKAAGIKSVDDLDIKKEDHKKIYFASVAPTVAEWGTKGAEELASTDAVKDWTPADDSDEASKKWKEENGDASLGLWRALGGAGGSLGFFAEKGIPSAKKVHANYETISDEGNPGAAAQFISDAWSVMAEIYEFAKQMDVEGAGDAIAAANSAVSGAQKVAAKISESGKEQQKESLELRKLINHMIIEERRIIKENK